MSFSVDMGPAGIVAFAIAAMLLGIGSQALGEGPVPHEWLVAAAGALVGGLLTSEWLALGRTIAPVWDGVAVVPALAGGLCMTGVANVAWRTVHHGLAARTAARHGVVPAGLVAKADPTPEPAR
jgi:hypothetical protein